VSKRPVKTENRIPAAILIPRSDRIKFFPHARLQRYAVPLPKPGHFSSTQQD
jgi:hypothetical protein